jgi:hypothetical protein
MTRNTMAIMIPISKTRGIYISFTANELKMRMNTKILSTLRLHSIR